ncbi:hypothetical protein LTR85_001350 [Meristemomyces frigidus]|nr:hypothetical protein LTR85_001350 [Meristemomyces frigidus]
MIFGTQLGSNEYGAHQDGLGLEALLEGISPQPLVMPGRSSSTLQQLSMPMESAAWPGPPLTMAESSANLNMSAFDRIDMQAFPDVQDTQDDLSGRQSAKSCQPPSDLLNELQMLRAQVSTMEDRLGQGTQPQHNAEAVLRMVWQRLVPIGDSQAQPDADLYNLVKTVTPNVIRPLGDRAMSSGQQESDLDRWLSDSFQDDSAQSHGWTAQQQAPLPPTHTPQGPIPAPMSYSMDPLFRPDLSFGDLDDYDMR